MSNTRLHIAETEQTVEALNALLSERKISADSIIAIHEKPADPMRIGDGNRAAYRVIYRG
jgi:hypothetical protein